MITIQQFIAILNLRKLLVYQMFHRKLNGNTEAVNQVKILRKSFKSSVNQTVLDTLFLPSEVERVNESKLLPGVLDFLKGFHLRKSDSKKQFAELLNNVCVVGDKETKNDGCRNE